MVTTTREMWTVLSVVSRASLILAMGAGALARPAPAESTTYVSVADAQGRPVTGLSAADFEVRVDNQDRRVDGAQVAADVVALVVAPVGSRTDLSPLRDAIGIIQAALAREPAGYRAGVVLPTVAGVAFRGPDDGFGALVQDFNRGFLDGPDLEQSIADASRALASELTRRRVVFAVARHDFGGTDLPQDATDALQKADVALWGVEITPATASGTNDIDKIMTTGAQWSGGRTETIPNAGLLDDVTRRLMALLMSEYVVSYEALDPASGGGHLRVGVRRSHVTVAAPAWAR